LKKLSIELEDEVIKELEDLAKTFDVSLEEAAKQALEAVSIGSDWIVREAKRYPRTIRPLLSSLVRLLHEGSILFDILGRPILEKLKVEEDGNFAIEDGRYNINEDWLWLYFICSTSDYPVHTLSIWRRRSQWSLKAGYILPEESRKKIEEISGVVDELKDKIKPKGAEVYFDRESLRLIVETGWEDSLESLPPIPLISELSSKIIGELRNRGLVRI
jgi:hypothetical protein